MSVATATALTSSASDPTNPPPYGQPVPSRRLSACPATYGTPTGSVEFHDETTGTDLGTVAQLTDNLDGTYSAALSVANLDVEDHFVTATYSGDLTFATSAASDPYDQEVVPASTTTTVSIADATNPQDGGNPGYGDQLTFTATVSPGQQPSGGAGNEYDQNGNRETVDFYDTVTGQYLGQGNLMPNDDGSATATWTGYAENWNGFPGHAQLQPGRRRLLGHRRLRRRRQLHRQPVGRRRDERRRRADYDHQRGGRRLFLLQRRVRRR